MAEEKASKTKKVEKKAPAKTTKRKTTRRGKKTLVELSRGKRKKAIARAVVKKGKGRVTINKLNIESHNNKYLIGLIKEPFNIIGDAITKLDIKVSVRGGGVMGQVQAIRRAIAVGVANYLKDDKLLKALKEQDRSYVVEDYRRVEPKKYKGRKARARFQKSYR
ncbi:MAG: 30S ribosomal protein S9 [Methanobacteriota archaeon]|nr:MAG: 30S ribosomal protein S9 [Euryarchaeota archaeon]